MSDNIIITYSDSDDYDIDGEQSIAYNNSLSKWCLIPDPILLKILNHLSAKDILRAGQCCRRWNEISKDDFFWKKLFQRDFKVEPNIGLKPGKLFFFSYFQKFSTQNRKFVFILLPKLNKIFLFIL